MNQLISDGDKPLDFGHDGIMGSLNHAGRIIALNSYHRSHGIVTFTNAPPFPDEARYDSQRVRAFRRTLVGLDGFGLRFIPPIAQSYVHTSSDGTSKLITAFTDGTRAECLIEVKAPYGIVQTWRFSKELDVVFDGFGWLQRHAYAQLTEGGVLPQMSPVTHAHPLEKGILLQNQALDWAVVCHGLPLQAKPQSDGSIALTSETTTCHQITLYFSMGYDAQHAQQALQTITTQPTTSIATSQTHDDRLEGRAYDYGRLCCVPVDNERVCILTDHMLLPLSWNRDAYYMARLLLCDEENWATVRAHLMWMFEIAERVNGLWGRSYLANGRIKDRGFQLDQQLFPLLELAEYTRITGDQPTFARLKKHIAPVFQALENHRDPHTLLYATHETPADDPIAYPYPLSSHVLLWHTLKQLASIGYDVSFSSPPMVYTAIQKHFVATPAASSHPVYAYATDGNGRHHFYHDANDMPLAFMPAWGFCRTDDAIWRATIDFAFSPANQGGYYDGVLGSVHTPAPWALGDIQEWVIARALGDEARQERVLMRLRMASQWDGALSEAYEAQTGDVVSRHWFLWTNAAYACVKRGVFDI